MHSDRPRQTSASSRTLWWVPVLLSVLALGALFVGLHPLADLGAADFRWQSLIPSAVGIVLAPITLLVAGRFSSQTTQTFRWAPWTMVGLGVAVVASLRLAFGANWPFSAVGLTLFAFLGSLIALGAVVAAAKVLRPPREPTVGRDVRG